MRNLLAIVALLGVVALCSAASATTITFDGLPLGGIGGPSSGPFTTSEAGFDLLIVSGYGGDNGGGDIEYERYMASDGTLTVTDSLDDLFTFESVDLQNEGGWDTTSVTIEGYVGASLVGSDTFSDLSATYSTFYASNLAGQSVDRLVILADRDGGNLAAVNDLVVETIPEPGTGLLVTVGLLWLTTLRRRTA